MPTYKFQAVHTTGAEVEDTIDARSEEEAQRLIRRLGYFVTRLVKVPGHGKDESVLDVIHELEKDESVAESDQMLFAEALSQALAARVGVSSAVAAAAGAVRSRRFQEALGEMAADCRRGYTLAASLSRTGAAVGGELLAALEVGEEQGDLPGSLAAFARRCDPQAGSRLAAAVGRRADVTRFAAALAQLLRDRPLTVGLIEDAARLTAGKESWFANVVGRVSEAMRNGATLPKALAGEAGTFDPLFCALVGAPDGRDQLRAVLARLGEASDAESRGPGRWTWSLN